MAGPHDALLKVDTILAPITAPGVGERSALRLSGPAALSVAARVFRLAVPLRAGHATPADFPAGDEVFAPVLLLCFRAPHSYTGEDVVEIHLDGWPALVAEVQRTLVEAGARPAAPGEFTRRAVVNGRLSLAQAVAVGRLISAREVEEAGAAGALLAGATLAAHSALREALLDALGLCEAQLDFEEEDTEAISATELREVLRAAHTAAAELARLSAQAVAADGASSAYLLGPPNAGKSALLAALCPEAQVEVSSLAGSTRDRLTGTCRSDGRLFLLHDGPGLQCGTLDSAPGPHAADQPESAAELQVRAMQLFVRSLPPTAVVLDVEDGERPSAAVARAERRALCGERARVAVLTKSDLPGFAARAAELAQQEGATRLSLCAPTGAGLPELLAALRAAAPVPQAPDLAARLESAVAAAVLPCLEAAMASPDPGADLPAVSAALREALDALADSGPPGALAEALLDRIFADFCIGK